MARSRDEIQQQIAALQAELDGGDDLELWVKDEKGRETRLTGAHAKRWLAKLGLDDDGGDQDQGDGDGGQGDGQGDGRVPADPQPRDSIWGRAARK
jgi:hypothetical protein